MTASLRTPSWRVAALLMLMLAGASACVFVQTVAASRASGAQARAAASVRAEAVSLFPRFTGAVPVLLYHRLGPSGAYTVAPGTFDAEMQRLHDLGFQAITLDQYVRFIRGEAVDLPQRPILITFDDGYLSAWENADPVLARFGWSAAMYIPTAAVGRPGHLTWEDLRQMQSSGRWQIDEHAGDGHVLVTADAAGRRLPFYACTLWSDGKQESFAHYKQRVSGDIEHGLALLAQNVPGWSSHGSFAVPFNNYGQNGSNDPRIEPWLSSVLKARFTVVFVQRDDGFTTPGPGFANRIAVSSKWSANALEANLLHGVDGLGQQQASRSPRRRRGLARGAQA